MVIVLLDEPCRSILGLLVCLGPPSSRLGGLLLLGPVDLGVATRVVRDAVGKMAGLEKGVGAGEISPEVRLFVLDL